MVASILLLLASSLPAHAQTMNPPWNPPEIMWARYYYPGMASTFYHVIVTDDGGYAMTGVRRIDGSSPSDLCIFKTDGDGDIQWVTGLGWYWQSGKWIEQLDDGGYVAVGAGKLHSWSSYSLFVTRLDSLGTVLWTQNYDIPSATEDGYCVKPLPDGGFVVCSRKTVDGLGNQAWVLRTDALGDTLWTREWGWTMNDRAMGVLYMYGGLTILMSGSTEHTSYGPHLVRYGMDGNLLWEVAVTSLAGRAAQAVCFSPPDGGYTITSNNNPYITHTDSLGNAIWTVPPDGYGFPYGWSIERTMGGYVYGGENKPNPDYPWEEPSGDVALFDNGGNAIWSDYVVEAGCSRISSVSQLPQGGYIAAGEASDNTGVRAVLILYAPETGVEGDDPAPVLLALSPSSNPFTSSVTITCEGPSLPGQLMVYDVTGRLIRSLSDRQGSSFTWDGRDASGDEIPAGTYLIQGAVEGQVTSIRVVRL